MHTVRVIVLFFVFLAVQSPSRVCAADNALHKGTVKVGVLPVRSFERNSADFWDAEPNRLMSSMESLDAKLIELIEREPLIATTTAGHIKERLRRVPDYTERVALGRERLQLGVELYKELRVDEAIPHLKRANALLTEAYLDLIEPDDLATLSLTLAQCLLEKGRADEAHIALKEMFFRRPSRVFKRGFYSVDVEQALERAWIDFVATYARGNPVITAGRLKRLMKQLDIDQLVYAYIDPSMTGGVRRLHVVVYEGKRANVSFRNAIDLKDQSTVIARLDRLLSRWTTCLPVAGFRVKKTKKKKSERFFVDTAFAYSRFLSDDVTRQGFNHVGLALSGEWRVKGSFGLYMQMHVQTTTIDPDRDLFTPYTTVRAQTGVSYSLRRSGWRFYMRAGLEAHFFGDFKTTTDPQCKFFGGDYCSGQVEDFRRDIVVGPTTALGFSFFLSDTLYATVRAVATFFAFPYDKITSINYPFGGEAGLGYAF